MLGKGSGDGCVACNAEGEVLAVGYNVDVILSGSLDRQRLPVPEKEVDHTR